MPLKNPVTQPGIDPVTVRLVAQDIKSYGAETKLHIGVYYEEKWKTHFCDRIPGNNKIKYGPKNSIEFVG
jgi:hypothetical protein